MAKINNLCGHSDYICNNTIPQGESSHLHTQCTEIQQLSNHRPIPETPWASLSLPAHVYTFFEEITWVIMKIKMSKYM